MTVPLKKSQRLVSEVDKIQATEKKVCGDSSRGQALVKVSFNNYKDMPCYKELFYKVIKPCYKELFYKHGKGLLNK